MIRISHQPLPTAVGVLILVVMVEEELQRIVEGTSGENAITALLGILLIDRHLVERGIGLHRQIDLAGQGRVDLGIAIDRSIVDDCINIGQLLAEGVNVPVVGIALKDGAFFGVLGQHPGQ